MASLSRRWASLAVASIGLLSSSALALPVGYDLQVSVETPSGQALGQADLDDLLGLGLIGQSSNSEQQTESAWLTDSADLGMGWSVDTWNSTIKLDPFITGPGGADPAGPRPAALDAGGGDPATDAASTAPA